MTATEQLKHQLDALPPELREAEAARILGELKARMSQRKEQANEPADDDRDHPLPEFERVPFECIKHLAGSVKGGPRDLASNKRYLEGLGESSMR